MVDAMLLLSIVAGWLALTAFPFLVLALRRQGAEVRGMRERMGASSPANRPPDATWTSPDGQVRVNVWEGL